MSQPQTRTAIETLVGRGEDVLQRLVELPGGSTALRAFNDLRHRVDDLTRRVRGIEDLEARVVKLEKELAALKRAQRSAAQTASGRKST